MRSAPRPGGHAAYLAGPRQVRLEQHLLPQDHVRPQLHRHGGHVQAHPQVHEASHRRHFLHGHRQRLGGPRDAPRPGAATPGRRNGRVGGGVWQQHQAAAGARIRQERGAGAVRRLARRGDVVAVRGQGRWVDARPLAAPVVDDVRRQPRHRGDRRQARHRRQQVRRQVDRVVLQRHFQLARLGGQPGLAQRGPSLGQPRVRLPGRPAIDARGG